MKGILIDPRSKRIEEIELKNDKNISTIIECDMIDGVRINSRLMMYVDDMGALPPDMGGPKDQRFFCFKRHGYRETEFGGPSLILGYSRDGSSLSTKAGDLQFIVQMVHWLDIHPVDVGHSEGWINHPVFGKMQQLTKKVIFAKGPAPKQKA
jgi:hypothetical protein